MSRELALVLLGVAACAPFSSPVARPEPPPEATVRTELTEAGLYALSTEGAVECTASPTEASDCTAVLAPEARPELLVRWDPTGSGEALVVAVTEDGQLELCPPGGAACTRVPFLHGLRGAGLRHAALGDVDGDGLDELVVGRPVSPDQVAVRPHVCWGAPALEDVHCEALDIPGDHFQRAALAHLDEDAHLDLLLGVFEVDRYVARPLQCLGDGGGGFDCTETDLPEGFGTPSIAVDLRAPDLDGDGVPDRLLRFHTSYLQRPVWCPGTADGRWPCDESTARTIAIPEFYHSSGTFLPVSVVDWEPVDLDQDGDLDLLGVAGTGELIDCRLDAEDYTCAELVETPCVLAVEYPELSLADLDADGAPDLVLTCEDDDEQGTVVACRQGRRWSCTTLLDGADWLGAAASAAVRTETVEWE